MPAQLITGPECCPCPCNDTVNLTQNITNVTGAASTYAFVDPVVTGTEHDGDLWRNQNNFGFWQFGGGVWNPIIYPA